MNKLKVLTIALGGEFKDLKVGSINERLIFKISCIIYIPI